MANLPPLSKTYSTRGNAPFQANTGDDTLRSWCFSLKEHMKGTLSTGTLSGSRNAASLWTVVKSSNGVTTGNSDLWATIADVVFANNGSNHSWIVLSNAALGYEVCIDMNAASEVNAGFVAAPIADGGFVTGGSVTARPTATGEFVAGTSSVGTSANAEYITDYSAGNSYYSHYTTANDGCFFFETSRTGLGYFSSFLSLQKTINARPGDTRNVFWVLDTILTGRGAPRASRLMDTALGVVGRNPNGTTNTVGGANSSGRFGGTNYPGAYGVDALSNNFLAFPVSVMSLGQNVYRGEIPDMYIVGTATVGASVPTAVSQERIICGDTVVPFIGVNPNF